MTVQELYDFAKEHGVLDFEIEARDYSGDLRYCDISDVELRNYRYKSQKNAWSSAKHMNDFKPFQISPTNYTV